MFNLGLSKFIPHAIYGAAIPVLFLTVLVSADIGLIFLTTFLPLQNVLDKVFLLPMGNQFVDFLVVAILVGGLIQRKRDDTAPRLKFSPGACIAFYIVWTFISLWWGSFYLGSELPISAGNQRLADWKNMILGPVLYFAAFLSIKDMKGVRNLLIAVLISTFLFDFFFFRTFRWIQSFHYSHDMRFGGAFTYLGPNEMASFFAQYAMVVLGLLLFEKNKIYMSFMAIVFGFTIYCLIYSFSRTAYFAVIPGVFALLVLKNKKLLLLAVVLLFFSNFFLPTSVVERINMTSISEDQMVEAPEGQQYDASTEARFDYAWIAVDFFLKSPVFGIGYRNFKEIIGMDAHNNFAKSLAELGLIGFINYILLYFLAIVNGWQLYKTSNIPLLKGLGLGFVSCVFVNMVMNLTHDSWSYLNLMGFFWVLLGVIVKARTFEVDTADTSAAEES